jgi:hypothetical protein
LPQIQPTRRPWEALEPELARALAPDLPALVEEVIEAVRSAVPAYRQPLEGVVGRAVRNRVEQALGGFLELVESRDETRLPGRGLYVALGRGEARSGRSLDALLAAYRAGAQTAWRRLAELGDGAGLPPRVLYVLAEAIFAYIDELSAASAEGYAQEQSASAGARQARRRLLLELLGRDRPPPPGEIEQAADDAGWPLPRRLAALAFSADRPEHTAARLPVDVLVVPSEGTTRAFVPDPDAPGRRPELQRALEGVTAALGPTVRWEEAARSMERAVLALGLSPEIAPGRLRVADEHLLDLILLRDRTIARDLAQRCLAPLSALGPGSRHRLSATLRAWLEHQGQVRPVAESLHVHVQTVRYRLGQLHELFGPALSTPEFRLELALALRVEDTIATDAGSPIRTAP